MVEGPDDDIFIKNVLEPIIRDKYKFCQVQYYRYQNRVKKEVQSLFRSITSMRDEFLCFTDSDDSPCVTFSKNKLRNKKTGDLDVNKIVVVKKEIESWYIAGLDDSCCKNLGLPKINCSEEITKEQFNNFVRCSRDKIRMSCMSEMMKHYNVDLAMEKNKSFRYFYQKHLKA